MGGKRGYTTGKYAFEFGPHKAGWIQSLEGGHATADVVSEKVGPDHIVHKHIAGVKYEDITVNCGTGMSKAFYEWIKASFDRKHQRYDGAIHGSFQMAGALDIGKELVSDCAAALRNAFAS